MSAEMSHKDPIGHDTSSYSAPPASRPGMLHAPLRSKMPPPTIVGGPAMQEFLAHLRKLSQVNARVLLTGETGVGKELIASYLHATSPRAAGPFVTVNCAGLSETLLESEMFGHVKGSFTGAYRDKPGKFELAHTGTLFLDEVGEMTPRLQGMLLRVLATGEVQKVGADHYTRGVDCRVVAATNRALPEMVKQGLFREDLYYRLDVIHVHVIPLRERREDIPLLVDFFLDQLQSEFRVACTLDRDVRDTLQRYDWPGNIRQLENVMQRLVVNNAGHAITVGDLPEDIVEVVEQSKRAPRVERRRSRAESLYSAIKAGGSFTDVVYEPYMRHEFTRNDLRELVRMGLVDARGNYRSLVKLFNVPAEEYKRLVGFLRRQECHLPFREFR
ncbi:MAG: sigma-54 dependent transcriptional regulator [Vicinamibacterales bacterium]